VERGRERLVEVEERSKDRERGKGRWGGKKIGCRAEKMSGGRKEEWRW
jgi:hypothetical protein